MMVTSARCREACHGCNKNILKHNSFVVCKNCNRICHAKCATKLYKFDFIEDSWSCWESCSKEVTRYNPFKSFRYDKYSHSNNNSFNEIKQIENILDNCSSYNMQELNDLIKANKSTFSIKFNNIDGVTSNFDLFSTKLLSTNNQISILTFAETNLDECNKNLFNIQGYQPPIYQSKINGKSKGSGLAIYVREPFLFTVTEEYNQCSPNLESLFITIANTEKPLTIGVIYRPPNG